MDLNKLYESTIKPIYLEVKQNFVEVFSNNVDERIKALATLKFIAIGTLVGGGYFLFEALTLLNFKKVEVTLALTNKVVIVTLALTNLVIGTLFLISGHDLLIVARNQQKMIFPPALKAAVKFGRQVDIKKTSTTLEEGSLDWEAYNVYKKYSIFVNKGTWIPIPLLWNRYIYAR